MLHNSEGVVAREGFFLLSFSLPDLSSHANSRSGFPCSCLNLFARPSQGRKLSTAGPVERVLRASVTQKMAPPPDFKSTRLGKESGTDVWLKEEKNCLPHTVLVRLPSTPRERRFSRLLTGSPVGSTWWDKGVA